MSVKIYPFGTTPDGKSVSRYEIKNGNLAVSVINYGATVQSIVYDGVDVALGYDSAEYAKSACYYGATVGREVNRIPGAKFTLNGTEYHLTVNNGDSHIHGGFNSFTFRLWNAEVLPDEEGVVMRLTSPDGEEGYPGNLTISVTFVVTADARLRIEYAAVSDKDTILNVTNHAYFNLEGHDGPKVYDTLLQINAEQFTESNEQLQVTGRLCDVEGTPFDFRTLKPIGKDIHSDHPQVGPVGGYDRNFVLGTERAWRQAAIAVAGGTGIRMECWTDTPGVQLYTANSLDEPHCKGGIARGKHDAFCLETQFWPDSIHHENFPSDIIRAGVPYRSKTEYRFSK